MSVMSQEMAIKYELVLAKHHQEPCAKISGCALLLMCMKVSTNNIHKFWQV